MWKKPAEFPEVRTKVASEMEKTEVSGMKGTLLATIPGYGSAPGSF
jgi:hypothetical protein